MKRATHDGDAALALDFELDSVGRENDRLDDDMGFDEAEHIAESARENHSDVDPQIGSASVTAPNYVPANTALDDQATPTFGDTTATYAGAIEPGTTTPWTAGWTAYPMN